MEIYVRGDDIRVSELKVKLGNGHHYIIFKNIEEVSFDNADVVFDLSLDDYPEETYKFNILNVLLIAGTLKCDLMSLSEDFQNKDLIVGLNTLPGFLNRDIWEMSTLEDKNKEKFKMLFPELKTQWVKDRVGMVSPRVLAMIINEACFTLEEGTANVEDIDKGMKLGVEVFDPGKELFNQCTWRKPSIANPFDQLSERGKSRVKGHAYEDLDL